MMYVYLSLIALVLVAMILQLAWSWNFEPLSAWQQYIRQYRPGKLSAEARLSSRRWRLYPVLKSWLIFALMIETGVLLLLLQQLGWDVWNAILQWMVLLGLIWWLAKLPFCERLARLIYQKREQQILSMIEKTSQFGLKMMANPVIKQPELSSRQEFKYLVKHDQRILSETERQIIQAIQGFVGQRAVDLMIPLEQLVSVRSTELLGPLKINELYQTGERLFVVTTKTEVMGMIRLDDLTNLDSGRTYQAKQLARRDFLEVMTDAKLTEVLSDMLEHDTQVALVGDNRQILGVIKLKTILKHLKIVNV